MPAALSSREAVLGQLVDLFREHGFEGTSIARISAATGLGRPSLYHYFPGGKEQMAQAVLDAGSDWISHMIVEPLADRDRSPKQRVDAMLRALGDFYSGGTHACIVNVFGVGDVHALASPALAAIAGAWIDALAGVARDAGVPPKRARECAEEALVLIQGALVVTRALNDPGVFRRACEHVRRLLIPSKQ